jgi:release factor glutamine methyltransferase
VLRTATDADLAGLPDLQVAAGAAFRDVGMPGVAGNPPLGVDVLRGYAAAGRAFVAGDPPVGFAVVDVVDGAAHLEQISVHPDHAGHGWGRRLIDHAETWAAAHAMPVLTLITFRSVPWNAPYYARLGFAEIPVPELTPELAALRRAEADEYGLDLAQRVVMRRDVYRPTVDVAAMRAWHDAGYAAARAEAGDGQTFTYLGRRLAVPPDVQPVTGMSYLLGEAVLAETRPADTVLDMGTGCGVNAILAAATAQRVVAVDINPSALRAAAGNAAANGVRVEVRRSDVFSAVPEAFDLIVFDPPFRPFAPRDALEAATTDTNYQALRRFLAQARDHLRPAGRILLFFGTSGDLPYLRRLIDAAGFDTDTVATADRNGVRYLTLRLR